MAVRLAINDVRLPVPKDGYPFFRIRDKSGLRVIAEHLEATSKHKEENRPKHESYHPDRTTVKLSLHILQDFFQYV